MLVVDKPPVTAEPPELPPFLKKKGKPERRVFILPDIMRIGQSQDIRDTTNNWVTTIHPWMTRFTGESILDPSTTLELAHSHSRRYRQWLETYETKNGVPPHIAFGGCIVPGKSDPTFYPRWCAWAREMFF